MKYLNIKKALEAWQNLHPLSEKDKERLSRRFTVDFNYNSNHIEGNTLTYGQTEILLLFGKVIGEADICDVQEMTASNVGLKMMSEEASMKEIPLTQNFIKALHRTLFRENYTVYRNLPGGMQTSYVVHAGQYRTRPNSVITRYGDRFEYASPDETPSLMADLVDWYNQAEQEGKLSPVELAALFHYRYIRIHPFEDGNGRIARLMVNFILARHNYPMIVVRSRKKSEYLEALHQTDMEVGPVPSYGAHADIKDIRPFLKYFNELIATEVYNYVLFLTEKNDNVWWYDGERISFRTPNYTKILNAMQTQPTLTLADMREITGISIAAIQKLLDQLIQKKYVERGEKNGSWRVFVTQGSVQNRDVEFETNEAISLYEKFLEGYIDEIGKLANHPDYKNDDSYHSIPSEHHIMYKYKVNDQGHTELYSKDGSRVYEFLIELDKKQAGYGIYYGCKGLVKGGCQKEQNEIFMKEWDEMKYEISEVLNNTFPDKDFTKRFRVTNNAENMTYWPFWIKLGDDEDVIEVAALAVKLICNVYKRYLNGEKMSKVPQKPKTLTTKTSFTLRDYMNTLKVLKNKDRFELFLKNAVACGYLVRDDRYEVCYRFVNVNNVMAAYLFKVLSLELGETTMSMRDGHTKELTNKEKIPWSKYTPIFLTENSGSIETLKQSMYQADHYDKGYAESAEAIFDEIMNFNVECQK